MVKPQSEIPHVDFSREEVRFLQNNSLAVPVSSSLAQSVIGNSLAVPVDSSLAQSVIQTNVFYI